MTDNPEDDDYEARIENAIYVRAASDGGFAIAYALIQISRALHDVEAAVHSVADSLDNLAPKSVSETFLDEVGAP